MNSLPKLRNLFFYLALTTPFWYFSSLSLLGLQHPGSDQSNSYWIIVLSVSVLSYFFILISIFLKRYVSKSDLILYLLPLILPIIFLYTGNFYGLALQSISLYLLFVMPASYIGLILSRSNHVEFLWPYLGILGILVTIGTASTIPVLLNTPFNELIDIFAGGHYQALSYFCSFAFLSTTFYMFFYEKRVTFLKFLILAFLILAQLITIGLSGGRGGILVVFFGIFVILAYKSNFLTILIMMIIIPFLIYGLFLIIPYIDFIDTERVTKSIQRLFEYIDSGGIDFSQSSNRDIFYLHGINYILESPIFGHGIFTIYDNSPHPYFGAPGFYYPHNFVLEVLIHGGILYLFFWILVLISFFIKLTYIIKQDRRQIFIYIFFIYSFTMLTVSGTYIQDAQFWFSLFYVFGYKIPNSNEASHKPLLLT